MTIERTHVEGFSLLELVVALAAMTVVILSTGLALLY